MADKKPNFVFFIVDELRHDTVYETDELKAWKRKKLKFQTELSNMATVFNRHYIGTTACSPSRTLIQTGQYPETNGVYQNPSYASGGLKANTCPTIGNYFQHLGYLTKYVGKWHVSTIDIKGEGGKSILTYNNYGRPVDPIQDYYLEENVMKQYGYNDWIGPDPTTLVSKSPLATGSSVPPPGIGMDDKYIEQLLSVMDDLNSEKGPWLLFASFINPHDITAFGDLTFDNPNWYFPIDDTLPEKLFKDEFELSFNEDLSTKPEAQTYYRDYFKYLVQPFSRKLADRYHRLYYTLISTVDKLLYKAWKKLKKMKSYENTIVVFTSDHGDLLGSHSYLHQKYFCAYEEVVNVPLMISSPLFGSKHREINALTSHIDLLPTLLSLSGLSKSKIEKLRLELAKTFSLALPLPGKIFSELVKHSSPSHKNSSSSDNGSKLVYFYTYDESISETYLTPICTPAKQVPQPCNLDMIIYQDDKDKYWKLTRYFNKNSTCPEFYVGKILYELYSLDKDPMELNNLALNSKYANFLKFMQDLLYNQSILHRYVLE